MRAQVKRQKHGAKHFLTQNKWIVTSEISVIAMKKAEN
jgi:hypothetical protein